MFEFTFADRAQLDLALLASLAASEQHQYDFYRQLRRHTAVDKPSRA